VSRRAIRIVLASVLLPACLGVLLLVAAYFMVMHRPAAYDPQPLTADQQRAAEDQSLKKAEDFFNKVHRLKPFVFDFEQELLNKLLEFKSVHEHVASVASGSSWRLSQPQVVFSEGIIELMALLEQPDHQIVVTVAWEPRIDEKGLLVLRMAAVRAGALPVPKSFLDKYLTRIKSAAAQSFESRTAPFEPQGDDLVEQLNEALAAGFGLGKNRQLIIEPKFTADENRTARITDVTVGPGWIRLSVEPSVTSKASD